jgi:Killing trait
MPEEVYFPPPGDDDDPPSSSLPKEIIDAIAIGNVKSVAEQSSMLSNLAYANLITNTNLAQANAVSNQQALNQLGATVTGKSVNLVANLSPLEAVASVKLDTGNDIAEQLADLKGTLEAFSPSPKVKPGA